MPRKTYFDKGMELTEQAKKESDPELRQIEFDAIRDYYHADIISAINWSNIIPPIIFLSVAVILTIISFHYVGFFCIAVFIVAYIFAGLLTGCYLFLCGKIKEKSFFALWGEGLKTLLFLQKKKYPQSKPPRKELV